MVSAGDYLLAECCQASAAVSQLGTNVCTIDAQPPAKTPCFVLFVFGSRLFCQIKALTIDPGRLAGPDHWAEGRTLHSAATSPGAAHRFGWRQSPGVQPPYIGRRVPAWHIQSTAADHRRAVREK